MTDLTGPFYTMVLELTVQSFATFRGRGAPRYMGDKDFQANYQKLVPLIESGYREVFYDRGIGERRRTCLRSSSSLSRS